MLSVEIKTEDGLEKPEIQGTKKAKKRSLPSLSSSKRKRTSCQSSAENDSADDIWKTVIASLKQHTCTELKMFKSEDGDPEVEDGTESQESYSIYLCSLVNKFAKLRRLPKLIAKLLCALRDNLVTAPRNDKNKKLPGNKAFPASSFLPIKFLDAIDLVIETLPGGQITDLWKTLQHNLNEECLKGFLLTGENPCLKTFLVVVSELFCHLLSNVKVLDYSVQTSVVEKVSELMSSLKTDSLTEFGSIILNNDCDGELLGAFLDLAFSWGELHGLQLHYNNNKYQKPLPDLPSNASPVNLSYIHSYLTQDSWIRIEKLVNNSVDISCTQKLHKLVDQKVRFMLALERIVGATQEDRYQRVQENLKATAKYICSTQEKCDLSSGLNALLSDFLTWDQIVDLASHLLKVQQSDDAIIEMQFSRHPKLHYAMLMDVVSQIMSRLAKIELFKKQLTRARNIILDNKNTSSLFNAENEKEVLSLLLKSTNDIIEFSIKTETRKECPDFSVDLIFDNICLLSELNLDDYQLEIRSALTIIGIISLIPLASELTPSTACGHACKSVLNKLASIVYKCGQKSAGSEVLFGVHWTFLFKWSQKNVGILTCQAQDQLTFTILQNIYLSAVSVAEFEDELDVLAAGCETAQEDKINILLSALQFLIKELKIAIRAKSKLVPKIRNHIEKLAKSVISYMESISDEDIENSCANYMRSGWLIRSVTVTTEEENPNMESSKTCSKIEFGDLEHIFRPLLETALGVFLPKLSDDAKVSKCADSDDVIRAKVYALMLLQSFCKSRKAFKNILPKKYISKLWNINFCLPKSILSNIEEEFPSEKLHLFPAAICEYASTSEFEKILKSLTAECAEFCVERTGKVTRLVDILLDAKLTVEKKELRTKFLDELLFCSLQWNLQWDKSEECLNRIALPFLRLQSKLLSRKSALCSLSALAICLTSITSIPFNAIEDTKLYRKVFCAATDVLNAFTLHRLDVITFRTHIYLQCFQYLMESLTFQADQKNKLSDDGIVDLRYCAHAIERICQSTKSGKSEFARIAPYFLTIMMKQFETITVYPAVKDPLLSGSYKLFNLCDRHGIAQTNSMLTIGSREIFTRVYELYNKFYRYKGKV